MAVCRFRARSGNLPPFRGSPPPGRAGPPVGMPRRGFGPCGVGGHRPRGRPRRLVRFGVPEDQGQEIGEGAPLEGVALSGRHACGLRPGHVVRDTGAGRYRRCGRSIPWPPLAPGVRDISPGTDANAWEPTPDVSDSPACGVSSRGPARSVAPPVAPPAARAQPPCFAGEQRDLGAVGQENAARRLAFTEPSGKLQVEAAPDEPCASVPALSTSGWAYSTI